MRAGANESDPPRQPSHKGEGCVLNHPLAIVPFIYVMPAEAGISRGSKFLPAQDPSFRWGDDWGKRIPHHYKPAVA